MRMTNGPLRQPHASKEMSVTVRMLSGAVVYEGERGASLRELQQRVAVRLGVPAAELLFCSADGMVLPRSGFTLGCELTVVRDEVMGLFM